MRGLARRMEVQECETLAPFSLFGYVQEGVHNSLFNIGNVHLWRQDGLWREGGEKSNFDIVDAGTVPVAFSAQKEPTHFPFDFPESFEQFNSK